MPNIPAEVEERNIARVTAWLRLLCEPGQVTELRALEVSTPNYRKPHVVSGFFDYNYLPDMARAARQLTSSAKGVYFVLNPLDPDLLSRCNNRVNVAAKDQTASDNDVLCRRWLLLDCDPNRKAGISASETEKGAAKIVAETIQSGLRACGWPEPILADSGNGFHLLYRIDLPKNDGGLVKRILHAVKDRWATATVNIDTAVFNPARICKLYGTFSRKGDSTPDRPHRCSKILSHDPDKQITLPTIVPQELLENFAPKPEDMPHQAGVPLQINPDSVLTRARNYLAKLPPAVAGQGGHDQTFRAACVLVLGFNLSVDDALPIFLEYNTRCEPPWEQPDLIHKLQDADKQSGPRGTLLTKQAVMLPEPQDTASQNQEELDHGFGVVDRSSILEQLQIQVLGEYDNRSIELFSEYHRKLVTIPWINNLTFVDCVQAFGEPAERFIYEGKDLFIPGRYRIGDVKVCIAHAAGGRRLHYGSHYGPGVWRFRDGKTVLVGSGEAAVLYPGGDFRQILSPVIDNRVIDFSMQDSWYDFPTLRTYLEQAKNPEWCREVLAELITLFGKWFWRDEGSDMVLAALYLSTWVETLWDWRPMVIVTGDSNSGKSYFFKLLAMMHGPLGKHIEKPTEAAVRQHVRNHAIGLFIDEFEKDYHRQAVLEIMRVSSQGGEIWRGSADQKGRIFRLRLVPWMANIETGLKREADLNRYMVFEPIKPEYFGKAGQLQLPPPDVAANLGQRCLAVALTHVDAAMELAAQLKCYSFPKVPARCVESFSVPCALLSVILGHSLEEAKRHLGNILAVRDFGDQSATDVGNLIQTILTSTVMNSHGEKTTVLHMMRDHGNGHDYSQDQERIGVRQMVDRETKIKQLFIYPKKVSHELLKGTDFDGMRIGEILARVKGAQKNCVTRFAGHSVRGISIPWEEVLRYLPDVSNNWYESDNALHALPSAT